MTCAAFKTEARSLRSITPNLPGSLNGLHLKIMIKNSGPSPSGPGHNFFGHEGRNCEWLAETHPHFTYRAAPQLEDCLLSEQQLNASVKTLSKHPP
ncbi:hypothetical protein NL676_015743 [Syzygium grande]|nr:hypothetical protein NL676_015743 [Syzygium grande]